jgi:transposase
MAVESVIRYLLLPELELLEARPAGPDGRWGTEFFAEKRSDFEVCPKCATPSRSVYDHRWVTLKDDPLRTKPATLHVRKRRFTCHTCRRPFTEPVPGV